MENYLSIGEVSRLLNIPEHTLRYWQDAGIFSVRQEMNNYRKYTMADLLNIAGGCILQKYRHSGEADGTV